MFSTHTYYILILFDSTQAIDLFFLSVPTLIAISRTCDYHHHWQDVTVGSLLGFALTYLVFGLYYPPLNSPFCGTALMMHTINRIREGTPKTVGGAGPGLNADLEASPVFESARPRIYNQ